MGTCVYRAVLTSCKYNVLACHLQKVQRTPSCSQLNIYIFIAFAVKEGIFLDFLHSPMKNIKSRDPDATLMAGGTSKPASDVVCLLLFECRRSRIAMTLSEKI